MGKGILAVLVAMAAALSLCTATVFADRVYDGGHDGYEEYYGDLRDPYSAVYLNKKGGTTYMKVGETLDMNEEMIFDYRRGAVSWTTSRPEAATVSDKGKVTAVAEGRTDIVATYADAWGQTRTITMRVNVSEPTVTVVSGLTYAFAMEEGEIVSARELVFPGQTGTIRWATSDADVAAVDADGRITAGAFGKCTVTATRTGSDGVDIVREIEVRSIYSTRHLDDAITITLVKGDSCDLRRALHPYLVHENTYGTVGCVSRKSDVVGVADNGDITAKGAGTSTVTVTHTHPSDGTETSRKVLVRVVDAA